MLVHILGDLGSGKTLFATVMASMTDKPVYANYSIEIENYIQLKPEKLVEINESTMVIIDEAYSWLESRGSGTSHMNKYLSYILYQSRKRGIDFFLTEQDFETVDRRFRRMSNYEVWCIREDHGFKYHIFNKSNWANRKPSTFYLPENRAKEFYEIYDTYQTIDPIDDNLMIKVSSDHTDINDKIDEIVAYLLDQGEAKDYTKGIVKDFCLRNDYPQDYVDLIYYRIKSKDVLG